MKSRIIVFGLLTLLSVGMVSTPITTGLAEPVAGAASQNVDTSRSQRRVPAERTFCGTAGPKEAEAALEARSQTGRQNETQGDVQAFSHTSSGTIPVYFHVIRQGAGWDNGDVPEHILDEQINVLNRSFAGQTGGAATSFQFVKAGVDRTTNATWFAMGIDSAAERDAKRVLHVGGPDVLNFYTIGRNDPVLPYAWATFPEDFRSNPANDGVVVPFMLLPGERSLPQFNGGDIGVHEVGHWLGLLHTHQGGCTGDDGVADTPQHREQARNDGVVGECPPDGVIDTCPALPGFDPIHNFMQSSSDTCKYEFTLGQASRMDQRYREYRQPVVTPTASIAWVQPSEFTWGPPNTMTVAGYAQDGFGNVQMVWRDLTTAGPWNTVPWEAIPDPATHTWSNTIDSPYRCHDYEVYVNYSGIRSAPFIYRGLLSGYCNESVRIIWIQPYQPGGVGSPGSLIVAGSAENAPGYPVHMWYRDVTAGGPWILHPYAPLTDPNNIWLNEIPNANYFHVYEVQVTYDVVTSAVCTYAGHNSISWCQ
jgi:hypothetical protein